jgi:hypothetical protein
MKKIVFASGIWNFLLGAGLLVPALTQTIGMRIPHPFWGWLSCGFLWNTSAVLILASRDLKRRGSFVYWEAFLRYVAAALLLTIGPEAFGWPAWFIGITDLAWGLIYTFGLPDALKTSHAKLFFDTVDEHA